MSDVDQWDPPWRAFVRAEAHLHPQLQAVAVHETFDLEVHQAWVLEAEELEDVLPGLHGLLAIGLEGLVHRGVQVLAVVHGRQVQVLRVRLPQRFAPFLLLHLLFSLALVGLQEGGAADLVLGHKGLPLSDACTAPPGGVATTGVRGNEVRAAPEALRQAQGAAEEQDARGLHLGAKHAQVDSSGLLARPADGRGQLEERCRQDLKLQAPDEGHDGLHSEIEGHGHALLDG